MKPILCLLNRHNWLVKNEDRYHKELICMRKGCEARKIVKKRLIA